MKKILFLLTLTLISNSFAITGFYKTIDDETGKAKSIIGIYENNDKIYGKILYLYNEDGTMKDNINIQLTTANKIKGDPKMCGLDVVFDMKEVEDDRDDKDDQDEYKGGKIIDPKTGKIYSCVIWEEKNSDNLSVRGKIGPFGRTQKWISMERKDLPKEISSIKLKELKYKKNEVK